MFQGFKVSATLYESEHGTPLAAGETLKLWNLETLILKGLPQLCIRNGQERANRQSPFCQTLTNFRWRRPRPADPELRPPHSAAGEAGSQLTTHPLAGLML